MDSRISFLIYILVKFFAYAAWCGFGVRLIVNEKPRVATALRYGFARLVLGVFFGVGIFIVGGMMHLNTPGNAWPLYFGIYAPVRWIEWSIMAMMIASGKKREPFLVGANNNSRIWRLGGILVSHLADIPLILSEHVTGMLPVGRFLC